MQFHHRNPEEKDFTVSAFIYHQKGGPAKLEMEIAKCDILCANCHLKYHYDNDARCLRIPDALIKQAEKLKDKVDSSQADNYGYTDTLYNNYFPEGIDPIHLTDEFYISLEHAKQK